MHPTNIHPWKNQLIYPILASTCLLYGWIQNSWILYGFAGYYLLQICCKKRTTLGLLCIFCSFFLIMSYEIQKVPEQLTKQTIQILLNVYPDSVKWNGDLIHLEGKYGKHKMHAYYQVENEQEKEQYLQRAKWNKQLILTGKFLESQGQRNLHGYDGEKADVASNYLGTFQIDSIDKEKVLQRKTLRMLRAQALDRVDTKLPIKSATYVKALLMGYRDVTFQEIREIYSTSGILHLFSISGMHIYIFYGWIYYFFRRIGLTFREMKVPLFFCFLSGIVFFGQSISVWRAVISYTLRLCLEQRQIRLSALDRFSLVLFLLLVLYPKSLLTFSGQLSIGMSAFIVLMGQRNQTLKQQFLFSQELVLLALPLTSYLFYEWPILGGVLTVIIGFFFSVFYLPFLCLLTSLQMTSLKTPYLIRLSETLIAFFEKGLIRTQSWVLPIGKMPLTLVFILTLIGIYLYQSRKKFLFLIPCLLIPLCHPYFSITDSVTFVDVGQGDSIVIQTRFNAEVYIIDTGGKVTFPREEWQQRVSRRNAEYTLVPYLKGEGIKKIDGVILTHGDFDHMGDMEVLLKNFNVGKIYTGKGGFSQPSMEKILKSVGDKKRFQELEIGDWIGRKLKLAVLAPVEPGKGKNEDSVVIYTKMNGWRFLFTGDLDQQGEQEILKNFPNLNVDVLKLGHHGSRTSSSEIFLEQLKVRHGVISCGENNSFKHPHSEVMTVLDKLGVKIYRTDQQGMIRYMWKPFARYPKINTQKETSN